MLVEGGVCYKLFYLYERKCFEKNMVLCHLSFNINIMNFQTLFKRTDGRDYFQTIPILKREDGIMIQEKQSYLKAES